MEWPEIMNDCIDTYLKFDYIIPISLVRAFALFFRHVWNDRFEMDLQHAYKMDPYFHYTNNFFLHSEGVVM